MYACVWCVCMWVGVCVFHWLYGENNSQELTSPSTMWIPRIKFSKCSMNHFSGPFVWIFTKICFSVRGLPKKVFRATPRHSLSRTSEESERNQDYGWQMSDLKILGFILHWPKTAKIPSRALLPGASACLWGAINPSQEFLGPTLSPLLPRLLNVIFCFSKL